MKRIKLTKGEFAVVDDCDFDRANQFKWLCHISGQRKYAARRVGWKGRYIYLHRFLTDASKGMDVDHDDGDGLNNRRKNLIISSRSRNLLTFRRLRKNKTSRYIGVSWISSEGCWRAQIRYQNKNRFLGRFDSEERAMQVYEQERKKLLSKIQ